MVGGCVKQATGGLRGTREGLLLLGVGEPGYRLGSPGNLRSYMGKLRRFVRGLNFRLLGGHTIALPLSISHDPSPLNIQ